jgi:glycine/D-amino acid oxidase-like deaminating enzyme
MYTFKNLSFWEKETFVSNADYIVVGSGIVGLSAAIFIKQRKPAKKVTVLERGFLPSGASTKNAGFACIGSPGEILDDLNNGSEDVVFSTAERRWKGLKELENLLGRKEIGYVHKKSYELFSAQNEHMYHACCDKLSYLNARFEKITGLKKVLAVDGKICKTAGFDGFTNAISHAAEGQINTGKMMHSLLQLAVKSGVIILNGVEVHDIEDQSIITGVGTMNFNKLLVCTNGFSRRFFPEMDVEPARAQVMVTSEIPDLKFSGNFHYDRGYYYFRNVGKRVLFGGGRNTALKAENTTEMSVTSKIQNHLEEMLRTMILPDNKFEIEHRWAGTMGMGTVKAPIVEQVNESTFCAIRLGGMGVAIGTLVGKELAQLATKN